MSSGDGLLETLRRVNAYAGGLDGIVVPAEAEVAGETPHGPCTDFRGRVTAYSRLETA